MALQDLLGQVIGAVTHHADRQQHTGFDPTDLLSHIEGLFGQHAQNYPDQYGQNTQGYGQGYGQSYGQPMPQGGQVLPASQDPRGDPADDADRSQGIRPASEDPLGDPADDPRYR